MCPTSFPSSSRVCKLPVVRQGICVSLLGSTQVAGLIRSLKTKGKTIASEGSAKIAADPRLYSRVNRLMIRCRGEFFGGFFGETQIGIFGHIEWSADKAEVFREIDIGL